MITFLLGFGISLSNSIEAGKALLSNRIWDFTRTPKYANLQKVRDWKKQKYQVPLDFTWVLELALICLGGISIIIGVLTSKLWCTGDPDPLYCCIFICFFANSFSKAEKIRLPDMVLPDTRASLPSPNNQFLKKDLGILF